MQRFIANLVYTVFVVFHLNWNTLRQVVGANFSQLAQGEDGNNRYIVKYKKGVTLDHITALRRGRSRNVIKTMKGMNAEILEVESPDEMQKLLYDDSVEYVEKGKVQLSNKLSREFYVTKVAEISSIHFRCKNLLVDTIATQQGQFRDCAIDSFWNHSGQCTST